MKQIKVGINGVRGNMGRLLTKYVEAQPEMEFIGGIDLKEGTVFRSIEKFLANNACDLVIDFTQPDAVDANAELYCKYNIPFVMGTTGSKEDLEKVAQNVKASEISAVIAPNMAKQVVGIQSMMEYVANTFPDLFAGYSLEIIESHQKGKKGTSGTAEKMVGYFNQLGIPFAKNQIDEIRSKRIQRQFLNIPEKALGGHGWHTYTLLSSDQTVKFEFTHNVNGRDVYALGTLDAIRFLHKKIQEGSRGEVFSMIDVLKG